MRVTWLIIVVIISAILPIQALQVKEEYIYPDTYLVDHSEVLFQGNSSAEHQYIIEDFHPLNVEIVRFNIFDAVDTETYTMHIKLKYDDGHNISKIISGIGSGEYNVDLDFSQMVEAWNNSNLYTKDTYANAYLRRNATLTLQLGSSHPFTLHLHLSYERIELPFTQLELGKYYYKIHTTMKPKLAWGNFTSFLFFPVNFMDWTLDDKSQNNHVIISITYKTKYPAKDVKFSSQGLTFNLCNTTQICSDSFEPKSFVIPIEIHYSTNSTMNLKEYNLMTIDSVTYDIDPNYGVVTFPYAFNRELVLTTMVLGLSLLAKYLWDEGGKQRMHNMRIRVDPRYLEEEMQRRN